LKDLVQRAAKAKAKSGAPRSIYLLLYEEDLDRAGIIEDRGIRVAFGELDRVISEIGSRKGSTQETIEKVVEQSEYLSDPAVPATIDVGVTRTHPANVSRMFHGAPATYADIRATATFQRAKSEALIQEFISGKLPVLAIIGAAGVGKTTFARQLCSGLYESGFLAWEHKIDFAFHHRYWIQTEDKLRAVGRRGVLFLDECTRYLRQTNLLIDTLAKVENSHLSVILASNAALWKPRMKSPQIYRRGREIEISRLEYVEIDSLLNILDNNAQIAELVDSEFKMMSRDRKRESLRNRCRADMFVCLKNIFATDSLDTIILQEYNELQQAEQEYYRYICALEATGAHVHRQLIIRMLDIQADQVQHILDRLTGIIDEYEISAKNGIYGWASRHPVISRIVAEYKFSAYEEIKALLEKIIDSLNPSIPVELRSIRDICGSDFGIQRLGESADRIRLYRRLIERAPGERIPWHRIIREDMEQGNLEEVAISIRRAEEAVGADGPIDRYKVRLLIKRAEQTMGISGSDRIAILRKAYELAVKNIDIYRNDKFAYFTLCDVAVRLVDAKENISLLDEAIARLVEAEELLLDPSIAEMRRNYEAQRRRLS
jgi:GTPase SAR1 family protein